MADQDNVAAMAQRLADAMAADLEEAVTAVDVLDWLASAGLSLRPDEGDATAAYYLVAAEDPGDFDAGE